MSNYPFVRTEKVGHVFRIHLNRPQRLNAQGAQTTHDRRRAWHEAITDPDVRVVVVSGEGRVFCAGRDIREQASGAPPIEGADEPVAELGFFGVPDTDIPIITAVQGGAWGLGLYFVCGSDICVAAEGARFAMSEIPTGVIGPAMFPVLCNLPWLPASEIVLRGHEFSAQRAYELGLINHVVPEDQLEQAAMEIAEEIARLPPVHVRVTKQQLMMARPQPSTYQFTVDFPRAAAKLYDLEDTTEAARAFAEKRAPVFKGR